ncbi:MAG: RNA-binding protein [Methylococcales bacterium]|nr:RNA-binding protein [Methylococcales bacterium]
MKLIIRNLARTTTESTLKETFEAFGTVQSCSLVMDQETKLSKGFAFIEMPKVGEAKAAIKNLNAKEIEGSEIRVKKSEASAHKKASPKPNDE